MARRSSSVGAVDEEMNEPFDVVIIGGGQAGLAMGYYLRQQGLRFVIFERGDSIAPAWRERWDSLTLFTPRRYSALPGLPFPGDPDGYPSRNEVIAYLERYAETFELPIDLDSEVRRLSHAGCLVLEIDGRIVTADQVVVATGPFQTPLVPKLAQDLDRDVWQVHSTGYRQPGDVPEGTVLVVGGGNTGFQIAKELSSTHKVALSVGSKQKPLPQRIAGKDLFWWLTKTHLLFARRRIAAREQVAVPGHANRLEPARAHALRCRAQAARDLCFRSHRQLRRRKRARCRRCHLGDWLSARLLLDRRSRPRRGRATAAPSRSDRRSRSLLPRPHVAVDPRLGADWLGEGRCCVPRRADRSRAGRKETSCVRVRA